MYASINYMVGPNFNRVKRLTAATTREDRSVTTTDTFRRFRPVRLSDVAEKGRP